MDTYSRVRDIYRDYIQKAEELEKARKFTDGLFGFGSKPADHPCQDQFVTDLEAVLTEEEIDDSEVRPILQFMYTKPQEHRKPESIYWMLLAVHGLTERLIDRLPPEEAADLLRQYEKDYPRWGRLPCQKKVIAKLRAR